MDEIAAGAGVVRSTLYVYFPNRTELLVGCVASMYAQTTEALALDTGRSPIEALERLIAALLTTIDEDPIFFRLAMAVQSAPSPAGAAVSAQIGGIGEEVAARVIALLTEGTSTGSWKVDDPIRTSDSRSTGRSPSGRPPDRPALRTRLQPKSSTSSSMGSWVAWPTWRRSAPGSLSPAEEVPMAVSAYILIQTEIGAAHGVTASIRDIEGVDEANDVTGPYDVIAKATARSIDELGQLVVGQIQTIGGITRTVTCPTVNL